MIAACSNADFVLSDLIEVTQDTRNRIMFLGTAVSMISCSSSLGGRSMLRHNEQMICRDRMWRCKFRHLHMTLNLG